MSGNGVVEREGCGNREELYPPGKLDKMPSPHRCPMCGAEREEVKEKILGEEMTAAEAIWGLAETAERFGPVAVAVLLLRCRNQFYGTRELAALVGITPASFVRLYRRVSKQAPAIGRLIRGTATKKRGVAGGRKPAGEKVAVPMA